MPNHIRPTARPRCRSWKCVFIAIAAAALAVSGCSNRNAIKAELPDFDRDGLVNTALFIPYENASQRYGGLNMAAFHREVIAVIQDECDDLTLLTPDDPAGAALMQRLAGLLDAGDPIAFSETARRAGLSAIITGRIAEVATDERSWGFWVFTDSDYYLTAQVDTRIFDVETGAKTMDTSLTEDIEIDGLDYDAMTMGQGSDLVKADKLLMDLAEDSGEKICKVLNRQPWIGYVITVDGDRVTLVPGGDAGLTAGMTLHIFAGGTLLEGGMDQRYFVPGLQTATIEVEAVSPGQAQARIVDGAMVSPGDSVRLLD